MQKFTNLLDAIAAAKAAGFKLVSDLTVQPDLQAEVFSLDQLETIWRHGGGPTPIEGSNDEIEAEVSGTELPLEADYALVLDQILHEGQPIYQLRPGTGQVVFTATLPDLFGQPVTYACVRRRGRHHWAALNIWERSECTSACDVTTSYTDPSGTVHTKTTPEAEIERLYKEKRERETPGYQARLEQERRWEDERYADEFGPEEDARARALSGAEVADD